MVILKPVSLRAGIGEVPLLGNFWLAEREMTVRALTRPARSGLTVVVGAMLTLVVGPVLASSAFASAHGQFVAVQSPTGHLRGDVAQAGDAPGPARMPRSEAVVLVGGGGSITPFVTPQRSCRKGPPAGRTLTPLYRSLNRAGLRTFTAPSMAGPGPVVIPTTAGNSDCGERLPARYTINSAASLNAGGKHLAAFLRYLARSRGITSVHLVGYSMGGNYARSAIAHVRASQSRTSVRSLNTLATGWRGVFMAEIAAGYRPISSCGGQPSCEAQAQNWIDNYSGAGRIAPALIQSTGRYLDGTPKDQGWNYRQRGALDGIPVTLFGGDYFRLKRGHRQVWPNDGSVSLWSQLAQGLPTRILPNAARYTFPVTHSQWVTRPLNLPRYLEIPANPSVIRRLARTINKYRT